MLELDSGSARMWSGPGLVRMWTGPGLDLRSARRWSGPGSDLGLARKWSEPRLDLGSVPWKVQLKVRHLVQSKVDCSEALYPGRHMLM